MTVRVAVVDDSTLVRTTLAASMPRLDACGSHPTVESLLAQRPDVDLVVLDLHLVNQAQPEVRQGVAAVRAAFDAGYRVCVYSSEERRFVLAACLAAGAHGVVGKSASLESAEDDFCAVAAGETVVPNALLGLVEVLVRRRSLTVLGPRQREVLAGRARGLSYAQMSKRLHLSESTLRGYWRDLGEQVAQHLQQSTASDIETALGLGPGDLLDVWPGHDDDAGGDWWRLRSR